MVNFFIGACPVTTNESASMSSNFEDDGRTFACPGELVTFTCNVHRSTIAQLAAQDFICRADPISYAAIDSVGSPGTTLNPLPTDLFQTLLTDVQRESSQNLVANFTVNMTVITTNDTNGTLIECCGLLSSSPGVARMKLVQAGTYVRTHF